VQDEVTQHNQQTNAGVRVQVSIGSAWEASGSASQSKGDSSNITVKDQSGLYAGNGGYDIKVKGNTDLKGAVIASTAAKENNSFTTGTLTTSDLVNHAEGSASSGGIALSSDMLSEGKYGAAKAVIGTVMNQGKATGESSGNTKSAIAEGSITITDDAGQLLATGKTADQTVASLNRDTGKAHTAATAPDLNKLAQNAQANQAIKQLVFNVATVQTDAAYDAMFKADQKFYKVTCSATPEQCMNDPKLIQMTEISRADAKKDGAILAVNGIFNDETRAGELAYQNVPDDKSTGEKPISITLMHIAPAATTLGELMVAGYEKLLAPTLGYTNPDINYADLLQGRGQEATLSLGHSRGTLVQSNAFDIAAANGYTNDKLSVVGVGGALKSDDYINSALKITKSENQENIKFTYMANDPIPVIAGGNPGEVMAALKEFYNVYLYNNSAHSCYGTGAAGCTTIANPVPGGPQPTKQDPSLIRVFRGSAIGTDPQPAIVAGG
jgi:filamentous hemagglutinin